MSSPSTKKTQNNFQPQEKTHERFIPYDANVSYDDITNSDISHAEFRVYLAILAYAKKFGHLSLSTEHFLEENPVFTVRQFQRHSEALMKKGFLYRFHHPLHRSGSMRYLIPKPYWEAFTTFIIKKHKRADWAAQVELFFRGGDYESLRKSYQTKIKGSFITSKRPPTYKTSSGSTRRLTPPPSDTALNAASINNINIIKEEENSKRGNLLPFFTDFGNTEITKEWMEYISKKQRLDICKLTKLYASNKEYYDQRDNPRGALIDAIKGGYADEKIHKAQEKLTKEKAAQEERETKAKRKQVGCQIVKTIQDHIAQQEVKEYTVTIDEISWGIYTRATHSTLTVGWKDPNSLKRLRKEIQKIKYNQEEKNAFY